MSARTRPQRTTLTGRTKARRTKASTSASLSGRVALVTGAGRGVGRAIATELARSGAHLVLTARSARQLQATARSLVRAGSTVLPLVCDVRNRLQVEELLQQTSRQFGRLDILINNAGSFQLRPFEETDEDLWDTILDTNLKGPYLVTRAALPLLKRSRGLVLNMVSIAGRVVFPDSSAYCASKWGLLGLTNVLRDELRKHGIRITAVLPGGIDTAIWETVPGRWNRKKMLRPETVAKVVLDICTQPAAATTEEVVLMPSTGSQ